MWFSKREYRLVVWDLRNYEENTNTFIRAYATLYLLLPFMFVIMS